MVSFRMALPQKETNFFGYENSSTKKRKFELLEKESKHVDLQLEKPLPFEWQQCLDLQSGEIHFYNTRTRKRTCKDPREEEEEEIGHSPRRGTHKMSLELELNLPYDCVSDTESEKPKVKGSQVRLALDDTTRSGSGSGSDRSVVTLGQAIPEKVPSDLHKIKSGYRSEPWVQPMSLIFPDSGKEQPEMVAAACMRCHMLVMLCKASPTCPNCKFMHPVDNKGRGPLFKQGLGVLCCKD